MTRLQLAWLVIAVLILVCNCLTWYYLRRMRQAIRVSEQLRRQAQLISELPPDWHRS